MKIVTWNCHYGLTKKKAQKVADWAGADIYFIQEVEKNDACKEVEDKLGRMCHWYGDHKEYDAYGGKGDLGIAIFSKEWTAKRINKGTERFRYVVPYMITKNDGSKKFIAFHVWTKPAPYHCSANVDAKLSGYPNVVYEAALTYKEFRAQIFTSPFIMLGDFNFGGKKDENYPHFDEKLKTLVNLSCLGNGELTYRGNSAEYYCPNDCIYVSPNWEVATYVVEKDCGGDHLPIMVELVLI